MSDNQQTGHPRRPRGRSIYLLPNLFTTAGLFAGFYAVVAAMKGNFATAAVAIYIAMLMDFFDGRVARLTNTQSAFGAQYDSLSDMLAFGIAPALVVYSWSLSQLGKLGWLAAFVYAVSAALRLARFNARIATTSKRYFQGLPSPSAAGIIAGMVWVCHEYTLYGYWVSVIAAIITVAAGLLMVSNVCYRSLKDLDFKGKVPFVTLLVIVMIIVLVAIDPPQILFLVFSLYGLSGLFFAGSGWWRKRRRRARRLKQRKVQR